MTPDAKKHINHPGYIRALVDQTGLTQEGAAKRIGVAPRTMRGYLKDPSVPYSVQYALEGLVGHRTAAKIRINVEQSS